MKTVLAIRWHLIDIKWRGADRGISLTRKQCSDILVLLDRRHNAEEGINWTVIDCTTDMYLEDEKNA